MPPRKRSLWPTAKAVSPEQAKPSFEDLVRELKSRKEAEERAVWRASGLEPIVRQSAAAAPSAEVSGWALLSPNLYRKLGGDVQHPMLPEKANPYWAGLEAATLLPFGRPLRAGAAGVKRLSRVGRGAKAAEEVVAHESVISLPVSKLLPFRNALQAVDENKVAFLAKDISEHGLEVPIILSISPSGRIGIDGHHRLLAAKHAGMKSIPVRVIRETVEQPMALTKPPTPILRKLLGEPNFRARVAEKAPLPEGAEKIGLGAGGGRKAPSSARVQFKNRADAERQLELARNHLAVTSRLPDDLSIPGALAEIEAAEAYLAGKPSPFRLPKKESRKLGDELRAVKSVETSARPEGAEKIVEALPKAKKLYREQKELRRVELGKRAAKVEEAMMKEEGVEGLRAGLREMGGELPKLQWEGYTQLDEATAAGLFRYIKTLDEFRTFEKLRAQVALEKVLSGTEGLPTRSEMELLNRAFGPETTQQILGSLPFWKKAKELGLDVLNVPRALRSSFDVSAPFRQGLVLGARHPVIFARELGPMFKALGSETYYAELMDEIVSRPTYKAMQTGGVRFTELGRVAAREEQFMSNLAEQIPMIGRGVRASSRAYTGFLNRFRADAFDHYLRMVETGGKYSVDDPKLLKSLGEWVSTGTGRGSIKSLEDNMVALNVLLWSPRLIASRLQLLNPAFYVKLHPFARKQAIRGMAQLLGGISLTLWIAKMAGAEVGMDPRSADFGKIKLGNTRVDIAGGFQQYLVATGRFIKGETVSSTTGKVSELEGGFAQRSRADLVFDFLQNKTAPVSGYVWAGLEGKNFKGDEFNWPKEGGRIFLPLNLENTYEGFKEGSPAEAVASFGLGSVGFGTQTYGPNESKRKKRRPHSLWVP